MKNLKTFLFSMAALALVAQSCSKDDDDPDTEKPKPTVSFAWKSSITNYTEGDGTVDGNTELTFKVNATPASGEKIKKFMISVSVQGTAITGEVIDSTFSSSQTSISNIEVPFKIGALQGQYKFTTTVEQTNGSSGTATFTLTVNAPTTVVERNNNEMGAQDNASVGSFFDYAKLEAKMLAQANANSASIDWVYFYGASNKATFSAPTAPESVQVFPSVSGWTTQKNTSFKELSGFDYDNADVASITAAKNSGGFGTKANNLANGDIVAFITQEGNYGVIKVKSIGATDDGTIEFDMKVVE